MNFFFLWNKETTCENCVQKVYCPEQMHKPNVQALCISTKKDHVFLLVV